MSIYNFYNKLSANYAQDTVSINLLYLIFTITMQSRENLTIVIKFRKKLKLRKSNCQCYQVSKDWS